MANPTPELRIGKKERDITLNILTEAYADERIQTREEYDKRVEKALEATTQTQLDTLTADLTPVTRKRNVHPNTSKAHSNSNDGYEGEGGELEEVTRRNKTALTLGTFGLLLSWVAVSLSWFLTVFTVTPPTETQTATVTSSTPISCNENTCNYPMVLTTNAGEKVEVEGKFYKSNAWGANLVPVGEEKPFQEVNGEWKAGDMSRTDGIIISTIITALITPFSLCYFFAWRHFKKYEKEHLTVNHERNA